MQRQPAHELRIEGHHFPQDRMAAHLDVLAAKPAAGIFYDGKSLVLDLLQRLALREAMFKLLRLGLELVVGELLEFNFKRVDFLHERTHFFDVALVLRPENFLKNPLHSNPAKGWESTWSGVVWQVVG